VITSDKLYQQTRNMNLTTVMSVTRMVRSYKGVKIVVEKGDITKLEVDAIVNAANSRLIMGGGVAGAILRAGGKEIQEEALKYAPVPVGRAVATTAGKLKAKYVVHAPTMEQPAMRTSKENVQLATKAALECAEQRKIKGIAFPGMGTGVGGRSPDEAAKVMVHEIKNHIDKGTSLEQIILVGYAEDLTQAFQDALKVIMP
jgi:O-acetyl-ADP-ribose deacetylase (regulator of RNase III)